MNQTLLPSWVSAQKRRSSLQRELFAEVSEALSGPEYTTHLESIWDE